MLFLRSLGVSKHQALQILTFSLSNASPSAYSTYKNAILSLALLSMHVMYCALHVGSHMML
jgi:hypothetical protein